MADDLRNVALSGMKKYRGSWINLGKSLYEINSKATYKEWGYEKFSAYVKEELGISPMTAEQMLSAYEYLQANEPGVLNEFNSNPEKAYVPLFQSIAKLEKINDADTKAGLKKRLFDSKDQTVDKEIRKTLKEQSGAEIMDDIAKQTQKVKRLVDKVNTKIHETSSFNNDIQETSQTLADKVEAVEV